MVLKLLFLTWLTSCTIFVLCSIPDSIIISNGNDDWELESSAKENSNGPKLNMTVFYESLCGDCVDFFKEQFSKNWKPFYDYLNVTLVPYGKASKKRDKKGNWSFECQHGEEECYANRIQACAINRMHKLRIKKLFNFTSCYMSHKNKDKYGPNCAKPNNIAFRRLKKCAKSREGHELLAKFGNMTHDFRPKIKWVPTIVFNNKYNSTENNKAASDIKSILCQKLENKPKACAFFIIILVNNNLSVFAARKERFLHFPPKTNIVLTMSLLKLFPNESIVNTLTEFDVFFPVPSHPFENKPRKKREADRNIIFSRLKEAADVFGLDSNSCLQKLICELQSSLSPSTRDEDNLLYDIFNIIFEPEQRISASECEDRQKTCQIANWINF